MLRFAPCRQSANLNNYPRERGTRKKAPCGQHHQPHILHSEDNSANFCQPAHYGLNGFTIEQLCEDVGVSRRTFFNYFPSKEDAIIGHFLDQFPADAIATFQ